MQVQFLDPVVRLDSVWHSTWFTVPVARQPQTAESSTLEFGLQVTATAVDAGIPEQVNVEEASVNVAPAIEHAPMAVTAVPLEPSFVVPATSSLAPGVVVPMPTSPELVMRIFSVLELAPSFVVMKRILPGISLAPGVPSISISILELPI